MLLLLDFDGTLCEFTRHPEAARLSAARRRLLGRLNSGPRTLAILSGRSLSDIKARVGLRGIIAGGDFGLRIQSGRWIFRHPQAGSGARSLVALRQELAALFCAMPEVLVENKELGLTLHERNVPSEKLPEVRRRLMEIRRRKEYSALRWKRGSRAWEIAPDLGWGKREAVLLLWRKLKRPYLIAVGDGAPDEEMFQAVRGRGAGVRVGRSRRSAADYWVKDVPEVYRFLECLAGSSAAARA